MKQGSCIHENSEHPYVKGFDGGRKKENIENIEKKKRVFLKIFTEKLMHIFLSFIDELEILDFN